MNAHRRAVDDAGGLADAPEPYVVTGQDWGLALLFSVQPSDRALAGHAMAGAMGLYLAKLARVTDPERGRQ